MAPYSGMFMAIDTLIGLAFAAKTDPRSMQSPMVIGGNSNLQMVSYTPLVIQFVKVISKAYFSVTVPHITIEIYLFYYMKQLLSPVSLFVNSLIPPSMTKDR